MKDIARFIAGFKRFRQQYFDPHEQRFAPLQQGQRPKVLLVGCSDSRVDPAMLTGCTPGELFVVRNVANLVPPCEHDSHHHGVSAALEYAVCALEVEHIIVLGHSGCGGISALMEGVPDGLSAEYIGPWVSIAERARERVLKELAGKDPAVQIRACEQASILVSLENLLSFTWIGDRVESGALLLHGWYFDIHSGHLMAFDPATGAYNNLDND